MHRRPAGLFQALVVLLVTLSALHTPVRADSTCAQYAELAGYGVIGHAGFTYGNNSIINDNDITGSAGNTPTPSGEVDQVRLDFPPIEPPSFPGGGSDVSNRDSLAPGTYGTVTVGSNQTVILSPGDYFIDEFDIGNKVDVVIQPPGQVRLYIGSELKAGNEFELNSSGSTGDLLLFLYGGASFIAGNANLGDSDLDFNGLLYSPYPDTHIEFGNNNEIRGAILSAGTLEVGNNTLFDYGTEVQQTLLDTVGCAAETRPHHIRIVHDGHGLTCAPETVSVQACADPDCQTPYTDSLGGQITGGNMAAGFVIPAGAGSVSVPVRKTTPGPTTLAASSLSPAPTSTPGIRCFVGASETCSMDFSDAGFIFDIPTLTAGQPSAAITLSAVKIADTGVHCAPGITGEQTVKFWSSYDNPATGSSRVSVNGQLINTAAPGTGLTLQFNAEAQAQLIVSYADVGGLRLDAHYDGIGEDAGLVLLGNDHFVVKPHRFEISAITCADDTVNPAASSAAEGKFCKAGEEFTLEVKAVNSLGAPTPNFGKETPPESVKVTSELVSGLELTNNPPPSYSFAAFGKNCDGEDESATACGTIRWGEVGIITLTPGVADGDYLGAGDVMGQSSGNIGRIYPHHFKIELPLTGEGLIDRADLNTGDTEAVCSTPFTYLGEGFKTRFRLSARNADDQITQNYDGAFAKLSLVNWNTYHFAAGGLPTGTGLGPGAPAPAGTWSEGEAEITAHHEIGRPADGSVAPPATVAILAAPVDSDGVTTASAAAETLPEAETTLRFGRLRLANVYGYYAPLSMPVEAQYWSGQSWVLNQEDNCTPITAGRLAADQSDWSLAAPGTLTAGRGAIALSPEAGAARSARICVDLDDDPASGVDCDASAGTNLPWLQGKWPPGTGHDNDPWATATFGIFRQEGRKGIYNRELY